jgi:predicted MFS family arabinose efflux permease
VPVTTLPADPSPQRLRSAVRATSAAFIGLGFAFASWASRIPQIKDRLELDPSELGLVLLAIAAGSVVALPLSGRIVGRLGSRRTTAAMAVLLPVALAVVAVGYLSGVALLVVGLFVLGLANGSWDVAMNVQGALVEQHLGRAIMSRFHAGFSLGTVAGALVGALVVAVGVPVTPHLLGAAAVVGLTVPVAVQRFVADHPGDDGPAPGSAGRSRAVSAWREPRTLLIGVFVLAFAFAEGTANDWVSVALIDGYGVPAATATVGFALFLTAMTAARWFGPGLLDRFGRVPVVRVLAAVATVGLLLFVVGPDVPVAFAGVLLWGVGTSLGFPVGMSAGADDPARAAARVSVVASVGYCAFLAGPPLIGFLGQHVTVLGALTVVAVLLAVATAVATALRPPATEG